MRVKLEIQPGTTIHQAAVDAQSVADGIQRAVFFDFNSVECRAIPGGNAELLADRCLRASRAHLLVDSSQSGAGAIIVYPDSD